MTGGYQRSCADSHATSLISLFTDENKRIIDVKSEQDKAVKFRFPLLSGYLLHDQANNATPFAKMSKRNFQCSRTAYSPPHKTTSKSLFGDQAIISE